MEENREGTKFKISILKEKIINFSKILIIINNLK